MTLEKRLEEIPDEVANEDLDELRRALIRTQKQLKDARQRTDELVVATKQSAYDATLSMGKIPPVIPPVIDKRKTKPEVALWHLTDWQGSKKTTTYNSQVMRERVFNFVKKARRITEIQRADHPVKDVVILFGGDMVEGLFNYPAQLHEIDSTLFEQYVTVSRLITEVVREALATYEKVLVVAEWGNHGRIGSKRADVPRNDNIDRMCYELARQLLADEKRLTWQDCPDDVQQVEVGNYRALLIHGDEVGRNGFASGKELFFEARLKVSDATQSDVVIGLQITDATPLDVSDGVFFIKADGSTSVSLLVEKNGTATTTSSVATMANDTFISLGFYYDGASSIQYSVNGVVKGTSVTTNLPDDEDMTVSIALQNGEAVAKTMTVDYVFVAKER